MRELTIDVDCWKCNEDFEVDVPVGVETEVTCPYCGEWVTVTVTPREA